MDPNLRYLAPPKLEVEPGSKNSQITFKHWKTTFLHFITSLESGAEAAAKANNTEVIPVDKLGLLVNFLAPAVYEYIIDHDTYEEAIKALEGLYIKAPSTVYARYKLKTHKQKPTDDIDAFYRDLNILSKDCVFKDVKANQHREEAVMDAFIAGLHSSEIRQRLLEEQDLTIAQAYDKARALEAAEKQSHHYLPANQEFSQLSISSAVETQNTEGSSDRPSCSSHCCNTNNEKKVLLLWRSFSTYH